VKFLKGFNIDKEKNASEWFTEIIKEAELADMRYGVKGFLVFQPWSVNSMEKMFYYLEKDLKKRGHEKYWYPTVIPEKNFELESDHVEGFTPQVFWVTHGGETKFEEKLALRPTSETAFYSMFANWIRSYKDLPLKTYQRANVFRYETKATRPFLRSREFYWLEAHNAFASEKEAYENVLGDMKTTKDIVHGIFGIPTIVFKRPEWDKFPGADATYGADAITPSGKVVQQPSTHMLGTNFSKPFNVKFTDENEEEKYAYITCYGPCVSRIFASVILTHGDNKGLKFPFEIAPKQVVIIPIMGEKDKNVNKKCEEIKEKLESIDIEVVIDYSDKRPGEKFYNWEMKGVPLRIEVGPRDIKNKKYVVYRRDTEEKVEINEKDLVKKIPEIGKSISKNLIKVATDNFKDIIKDASSVSEVKKIIGKGIARVNFCTCENDGESCAEVIEKETGGEIRGTRIDKEEKASGKCIVCGKKANVVTYIAKSY
jgi:prolyl-tRNA synthetase